MKNNIIKIKGLLLMTILSLLGFSACEKDDGDNIVPCYGVRVSKFEDLPELQNNKDCIENPIIDDSINN
jgi:hypothetical protein